MTTLIELQEADDFFELDYDASSSSDEDDDDAKAEGGAAAKNDAAAEAEAEAEDDADLCCGGAVHDTPAAKKQKLTDLSSLDELWPLQEEEAGSNVDGYEAHDDAHTFTDGGEHHAPDPTKENDISDTAELDFAANLGSLQSQELTQGTCRVRMHIMIGLCEFMIAVHKKQDH